MWNVLYSLEIPGTFAPVSRGWGRPWVVFDWVRDADTKSLSILALTSSVLPS
jgi:hypothetical protein